MLGMMQQRHLIPQGRGGMVKWVHTDIARHLALMALAILVAWQPATSEARGTPDGFADLAERLLPAVVSIQTTQIVKNEEGGQQFDFPPGSPFEEFFERFGRRSPENRQRRGTALGSGFVIDSNGIIVTNNHVIAEADEIVVVLQDDTRLEAELVGRDPRTDIAVLRVEPDSPLPAVEFGDSDISRVGDWVIAIGNPLGLGGTVTAGIISARSRDIRSGPYDDYIQTDAPINRGNSGGPLFNMDGEVIGINTAIFSQSGGSIGIGFSIPSNQAMKVIKQLREFGTTRRGWLGVTIQPVTDELAESLGLAEATGALVANVHEAGPSAAGGIKNGDIILEFNNRTVPSSRMLPRMVANTEVGARVPVVVWRDGGETELFITLGELEKVDLASLQNGGRSEELSRSETKALESLDATLAELDGRTREEYGISPDIEGVLIVDVDENGIAAEKGLRQGDLIVEVAQNPVSSIRDVAEIFEQQKEKGRKSVLLRIRDDNDFRFIAIQLRD